MIPYACKMQCSTDRKRLPSVARAQKYFKGHSRSQALLLLFSVEQCILCMYLDYEFGRRLLNILARRSLTLRGVCRIMPCYVLDWEFARITFLLMYPFCTFLFHSVHFIFLSHPVSALTFQVCVHFFNILFLCGPLWSSFLDLLLFSYFHFHWQPEHTIYIK